MIQQARCFLLSALVLVFGQACATSSTHQLSVFDFAETCSEKAQKPDQRVGLAMAGVGLAMLLGTAAVYDASATTDSQSLQSVGLMGGGVLMFGGLITLPVTHNAATSEAERCRKIRAQLKRDLDMVKSKNEEKP